MQPHPQDVSAALWMSGIALCLSLIAIVFVVGLLNFAEARTDAIFALGDCVVATAEAQGYPAPHSEEAWKLFAPGCANK